MKATATLEKILSEFEDFIWLGNLCDSEKKRPAMFPESSDFRQALVSNNKNGALRFIEALAEVANKDCHFNYQRDAALDLYHWTFDSRRIFTVSSSLNEMLLNTNLPDFKANEITFSVPSFAIHLEEPIQFEDGRWYDFIILRTHCGQNEKLFALSIRAFEVTYRDYRPLTAAKKKVVERDAHSRSPRFDKFMHKIVQQADNRKVIGYLASVGSDPIPKAIRLAAPENELEDWIRLYQLGIGLNLYLQTARLPEDTEHVTNFHYPKVMPKDTREPFTNRTEIFSLGTSQAFSRHHPSKSDEDESVGSVRPHFRRGFWRRPKGFGNDPAAAATIWVRPTWVHQAKIDAGEQPVGSNQSVQNVSNLASS